MSYSKVEIGKGLKAELEKGYNVSRISDWADDIFFSVRGQRSTELDDILESNMYTAEELNCMADKLLNNKMLTFPFEIGRTCEY